MNENRLLKRCQASIKEQNLNYANVLDEKAEIAGIAMFDDDHVNKENDQLLVNN
jgi:hypothetical protein